MPDNQTAGVRDRQSSQSAGLPLALADWRFLLPEAPGRRFEHLLLLGATPGLADRLIELGLAERISCTPEGRADADAVVVLNDGAPALPWIARCVKPGGVLYLEVHRRASGRRGPGPRRVSRQLRSAGLVPVQAYAVWPGFSERRTYLPFDVPSAFRWYLSTLRAAPTGGATVLETGVRTLLALAGRRVASLVPSFAVVARAGTGPAVTPGVLRHGAIAAGLGSNDDCRMVLLTHGGDRAVVLLFRHGGGEPVAVLKVPRLPAFNGRTANEQQVLSSLAGRLDLQMRGTVPEPLGLFTYQGLNVAVESYRPGTPVWRSIRRWTQPVERKVGDLHAAASWLAEFHRQTEVSRLPWTVDEAARWVGAPLEAYERAFGATVAEERLFARARSYAAALLGTLFPIVWQHRDFKPNHVLRLGGSITVIDWEGGRPGPALCDLLHFVVHWHAAVRGVPGFSGLSRIFFDSRPADEVSRGLHGAISTYTRALGLDARLFPILLLYTCVELVLRRAEQQRLQGDATDDPRSGNRNFELLDVLARHADELFRDDHVHACAG